MGSVRHHKDLKPDHHYFIGKQWIFLEGYFRRPRRWRQSANALKINCLNKLYGRSVNRSWNRFSLTPDQQFTILEHPPGRIKAGNIFRRHYFVIAANNSAEKGRFNLIIPRSPPPAARVSFNSLSPMGGEG